MAAAGPEHSMRETSASTSAEYEVNVSSSVPRNIVWSARSGRGLPPRSHQAMASDRANYGRSPLRLPGRSNVA
jgi:hypothetical protein